MASEKMSVLFMRDSGESRRFRIHRVFFRWILFIFFILCPLLSAGSLWFAHSLWVKNVDQQEHIETLMQMNAQAIANAERLEHLELLLVMDTEIAEDVLSNISKEHAQRPIATQHEPPSQAPTTKTNAPPRIDEQDAAQQEGPGHADFPAINSGEVLVESVNSRLVAPNRLRTAFDIRNPGEETLSGVVSCILSLANGQTVNLAFIPEKAGFYRIQRWKRAVLVADIDGNFDMMNAQVIIEIHNEEKVLVYRNIFPIEQK